MAGSADVPLVGRSDELGRVLAALERASAGSGGALLLAGEPGIGKSRLAAEALTLARQRGFVTLQGVAYPLQADLAYAPVLEALRPFLAGLEPGGLAALVRGLPDLGRLFAGLHLPPPEPLGDADLERTRLFEAVSRLIERVAAERPVALLVDDLHWADAASLELLHYLARGLAGRRVLLLGTYRLDSASATPSSSAARSASAAPSIRMARSASATPSSPAARSISATPSSLAARWTSAALETGQARQNSLGRTRHR